MKKKSIVFIALVMFYYLSMDAQHKIYSYNGFSLGTTMSNIDCGNASIFGWIFGINMGFFHFDLSSNSVQTTGKFADTLGDSYVVESDKVRWDSYNFGVNLELGNCSEYRFIFTPKIGLITSRDIDINPKIKNTYITQERDNKMNYGIDISMVIPSTKFYVTCGTSIQQPLTASIGYRYGICKNR